MLARLDLLLWRAKSTSMWYALAGQVSALRGAQAVLPAGNRHVAGVVLAPLPGCDVPLREAP